MLRSSTYADKEQKVKNIIKIWSYKKINIPRKDNNNNEIITQKHDIHIYIHTWSLYSGHSFKRFIKLFQTDSKSWILQNGYRIE